VPPDFPLPVTVIPPAIDPVCGVRVEPGGETRQIEFNGRLLDFCSPSCAAEFSRDPARFLRGVGRA